MKRVLLINPPSSTEMYKKGMLRSVMPRIPLLSLASLAGALDEAGHLVDIADLAQIGHDYKKQYIKKLEKFQPTHIGVSFTTPLYREAIELVKIAKEYDKNIFAIAGGVHPTILSKEVESYGCFDSILIGEGERAIVKIVEGNLRGIVGPFPRIEDLDELPMPAWFLFDLKKYGSPLIFSRKTPVGAMETSRGCFGKCVYCIGPLMSGNYIRTKSFKRILQEFNVMQDFGFKEIHFWDDSFTAKPDRAVSIVSQMIDSGIDIPVRLDCGIRVDSVFKREDFFNVAAKSSIYGVSFGYESGNQGVLNSMRKGIKLEQSEICTKLAKQHGLETIGFFMLGNLADTPETIEDTIKFAIKLDPLYAKFTKLIPFPGTEDFNNLDSKGLIKTKDWTKYNFHSDEDVFVHPHPELTNEFLWDKYKEAHGRFYLRGGKIVERMKYDINRGLLFTIADIKTAYNTFIGG